MPSLPQQSGALPIHPERLSADLIPFSPITLWHLLSLDAPTVATVWTCFAARVTHTTMAPEFPVAMFFAVWILYAADRLLDARQTFGLEARHSFHAHHRSAFQGAIAVASVVLCGLLVEAHLPRLTFVAYLLLAGALGGWFATVHGSPGRTLPKEVVTGLCFGIAVFIPFAGREPMAAAIFFAALCTLNCLYIHAWENDDGADAHPTTRLTRRFLPQLSVGLALLPLLHPRPIGIAVSLAALMLLALHRFRKVLEPTTLRASADLVLLTPLLVLPFLS